MDLTQYQKDFIVESNRIEGIFREPTVAEIEEFLRFESLSQITVEEMEQFVSVYQPGAKLRSRKGMNVRVGNHLPPAGDPDQRNLERLLNRVDADGDEYARRKLAFEIHLQYETLYPFMDGNGRSGRILWWWMMGGSQIGFLHMFTTRRWRLSAEANDPIPRRDVPGLALELRAHMSDRRKDVLLSKGYRLLLFFLGYIETVVLGKDVDPFVQCKGRIESASKQQRRRSKVKVKC